MTLRKIQILAVAVVLSFFFFASDVAQTTTGNSAAGIASTVKAAPVQPANNWTYEGCWTQFPAGPCRDIYRDSQGGYWICGDCGSTSNPSSSKCSRISAGTLASGYWCS